MWTVILLATRGEGFADFGDALKRWLDDKINGTDNALMETAEEVAEKGKNITQYHIETRGTAKSGKRGRVETGAMRDAVSGDARRVSRGRAQAEFGWNSKTPEYAIFQERGFTHSGGTQVEGMYALADAADEVLSDLKEDLEQRLKDV